MPYTPPSGHTVNFNFTDTPYVRPAGHSILFNFGAVPGPPFVDTQLPTGLRQHFVADEDWYPQFKRLGTPITDSIIAKPMKALFRLDDDIGTDFWMLPKRRILVTPPFPGKRPVLFTVT
jgi:hypothetical protein